MLYIT